MEQTALVNKIGYPLLLFALFYFGFKIIKEDYVDIFTVSAVKSISKINMGDSAVWSSPDFDDSSWGTDIPVAPYNAWIRNWINLDSSQIKRKPIGLGVWTFPGSYNLFWDGNLIGNNGSPGDSETEVPGQIDKILLVPDSLVYPGSHLIAMRASQQNAVSRSSKPYFIIENYDTQSKYLIIIAALVHIISGVFFIISLYYFFVYFKSYRQPVFLLFAIICLLLFCGSLLHFIKFYYKYPYPYHIIRLTSIEILTLLLSISLVAYFLFLYNIPRVWKYLSIFSLLTITTFFTFHNYRINYLIYILYTEGVLFSVSLTVWAVYKNKKNSLSSLYSLAAPFTLLFFLELYFYDLMIYLSFFSFTVFNLYTLSKTIGEQKRKYETYLVESNRLKMELLKKNIQPHFIMNTLTSLISWVEESPNVAVKFIEALAEEFRILVDISDQNKVLVYDEIELCKTHLKVMSYRNEINYQLVTSGLDYNNYIPPAIFLTILENGITHNIHECQDVEFSLIYFQKNNEEIYLFFSPGKIQERDKAIKDGTGLKYIKARLTELYGEKWQIDFFQKEEGWETKISIFK